MNLKAREISYTYPACARELPGELCTIVVYVVVNSFSGLQMQ